MPLAIWQQRYPEKFVPEEAIFSRIHPGHVIFLGSACAEPQHLVRRVVAYVEDHPKAFVDTELLQLQSLGVIPYAAEKFQKNFRINSFFIGDSVRTAVNRGLADYTPIFLSQVPGLFQRGLARVDVALIQTSLPDEHGYVSVGISVDIVKAAVKAANLVIAQINRNMPRVHGDAFVHLKDIDFIVPFDEPILEYGSDNGSEAAATIGEYVARLIADGDTLQVGFGRIPNAVLKSLKHKQHLGIHSELISDGVAELMELGVIDNSQKTLNPGKTVTTFCIGKRSTYEYLNNNPAFEFRQVHYTNDPLTIARQERMVAINSVLEIDLTGQATAESLGPLLHSGVGGQADFMRGAILARGGKSILAFESTGASGKSSRIVPVLREGAGTTLHRGDVHYVVTEYGIAYLHGKSIRERAMALIAIAHPDFRPSLLLEAKRRGLVYPDQAIIPGEGGTYPRQFETHRTTVKGLDIFLRPVKISDESLLRELTYAVSEETLYRRFMTTTREIPHEAMQKFVVVDYTSQMGILAILQHEDREEVIGVGRYYIDAAVHTAEVAFLVRDDYQNRGVGRELLAYLTYLAKRQGLLGFHAEVLSSNKAMLHVFEQGGFDLAKRQEEGMWKLTMKFR